MTKRKITGRAAKRPTFTGELAKPIGLSSPDYPGAATQLLFPRAVADWERAKGEAWAEALKQTLQKIPLLAQHYGISDGSLSNQAPALLLCVCRDFIPGFKIAPAKPSHRGRPRTRGMATTRLQFILDVQITKAEKRLKKDRDALWELIKSNPRYRPSGGVPRSEILKKKALDTLEARYGEAKSNGLQTFAGMVERMCKDGKHQALSGLDFATEIADIRRRLLPWRHTQFLHDPRHFAEMNGDSHAYQFDSSRRHCR